MVKIIKSEQKLDTIPIRIQFLIETIKDTSSVM